MRIAHFSDTHLGYNGFGRQPMVADPLHPHVQVRQQEADLMLGLRRTVDVILQHRPDLVIHSGDLFDGAHPSPRTVQFALREFWRFAEARIPVVIIEGDHSCPRAAKDGHVLALFERIPHLHAVCGQAQCLSFGSVKIHALSHQALFRDGLPQPSALTDADGHVLVTHGVADGHHVFKTGRSACNAPIQQCAAQYDYVALGHCHRFAQVPDTENAFYPGSTAPVVLNDFFTGSSWGFNMVDISSSPPRVERILVKTRPVNFYGLHDARGLSASEILAFLNRQAQEVPPSGAYCCIEIAQMELLARRDLSMHEIEEIFAGYAGLRVHMSVREQKAASNWIEGSYEDQFDRLVEAGEGDPEFKNAVRELGHRFLRSALQTVNSQHTDVGTDTETEVDALMD